MRHRHDHKQLSRTASHRKALLRNQVTALFLHERIETTLAKAKETRRLAERLITYAKRNNLHSRRLVARVVQERAAVTRLFDDIAPLYTTREGGYTRILKTRRRLGDAGEMAFLELVKTAEQKAAERRRKQEAEEATQPVKKRGFFSRGKKAEPADATGAGEEAGEKATASGEGTKKGRASKAKAAAGPKAEKPAGGMKLPGGKRTAGPAKGGGPKKPSDGRKIGRTKGKTGD